MKNFDLENLEKKTPYNIPNDFFADMQKNVLNKTINATPIIKEEKTKVIKLDFRWFAAAAVVLIAGLTAFFNTEDPQKELILAQKSEIIDSLNKNNGSNVATIKNDIVTEESKNVKIEAIAKTISTEIIKENDRQPITLVTNKTTPRSKTTKANTETRLNQSLAAFTSAEISEIERSTEQDVYLDLYN